MRRELFSTSQSLIPTAKRLPIDCLLIHFEKKMSKQIMQVFFCYLHNLHNNLFSLRKPENPYLHNRPKLDLRVRKAPPYRKSSIFNDFEGFLTSDFLRFPEIHDYSVKTQIFHCVVKPLGQANSPDRFGSIWVSLDISGYLQVSTFGTPRITVLR